MRSCSARLALIWLKESTRLASSSVAGRAIWAPYSPLAMRRAAEPTSRSGRASQRPASQANAPARIAATPMATTSTTSTVDSNID
jgi:hypothetical protein